MDQIIPVFPFDLEFVGVCVAIVSLREIDMNIRIGIVHCCDDNCDDSDIDLWIDCCSCYSCCYCYCYCCCCFYLVEVFDFHRRFCCCCRCRWLCSYSPSSFWIFIGLNLGLLLICSYSIIRYSDTPFFSFFVDF